MERFSDDDKQAVFELVNARLFDLFGPGGSFRITLGRASADDAVFVSTVSETIAWQVAAALELSPAATEDRGAHAARAAEAAETAEHDHLWRHIEEELLAQRRAAESLSVRAESVPAHAA